MSMGEGISSIKAQGRGYEIDGLDYRLAINPEVASESSIATVV